MNNEIPQHIKDKIKAVADKQVRPFEFTINAEFGYGLAQEEYPLPQVTESEETWQQALRRMRDNDEFDDKFETTNLAFAYAFQMGFKAAKNTINH